MFDLDNGLMFDEANGRVVNATTFSFDFDDTISRDPVAFLHMMNYLQGRGHNVIVCTARLKEVYPEDLQFLIDKGYKVYWSEHKSKKDYLESLGIHVNVWIDDCPEAVLDDFDGQPRINRNVEE